MFPSASALLDWYARHRRVLPWRALPGERTPPYHVWLSEIMLQQTTVAAVRPYYHRFLERFPTVEALAQASQDEVFGAWAGLGYYRRARNLHACARDISARGGFPETVAELKMLPGIGDYTSRAIAAIAFGVPVVPVDGNVERITARLFHVQTPLPASRRELDRLASGLNSEAAAQAHASDFAQALFDLGATICTPRNPACALCPWLDACTAFAKGDAASLPRKAPRVAKPERYGVCFVARDATGGVWLRKRPDHGLLAGMAELPGTTWRATSWEENEALALAPVSSAWRNAGMVRHVFTHLVLHLRVYTANVGDFARLHNVDGFACPAQDIAEAALPSVMRKCLALAG